MGRGGRVLATNLALMLRPAGGGVYAVSTGRREQLRLQKLLYQAHDENEIGARWTAALDAAATARVIVLGVPSDTGAGLVRGAAHGPAGIRTALLDLDPDFFSRPGLIDVGDVICVPQLLDDDMLNDDQKARTRRALYGEDPAAAAADLPVAPLDIAHSVLGHLRQINPNLRPMILGGDHSVAWPVVRWLADQNGAAGAASDWGIVQFDAHTDLLPERLGVKHCFATWAYHANQALGAGGRLVQIGIRASGRDRTHWETTQGVRQFWATAINRQPVADVVDEVIAHFRARGIKRIYVSNDIDGTDSALAPATGTPEPDGLDPTLVLEIIKGLGAAFQIVAGDLVEVAPVVGGPEDGRRTCAVAARYVQATVNAMLGE